MINVRDTNGRDPEDESYDPKSLFIPQEAWKEFSKLEKTYWEAKSKHFDLFLIFKTGNQYEIYFDEAEIGHKKFSFYYLEKPDGVKYVKFAEEEHLLWVTKFRKLGYKVAIVDSSNGKVKIIDSRSACFI